MKTTSAALVLSIFMDAITMPSDAFLIDARPSHAVVKTRVSTYNDRKIILTPSRGGGSYNDVNVRMNASASASTATASDDSSAREQTIAAAAFNLIKGCVGAGVLSLPAGVAAIGDVPKA
jgi:hypothetical protein